MFVVPVAVLSGWAMVRNLSVDEKMVAAVARNKHEASPNMMYSGHIAYPSLQCFGGVDGTNVVTALQTKGHGQLLI